MGTSVLRRIIPSKSSHPPSDVDDEYNVEYSFAMEYTGPPVTYDIPRVIPVDIGRIPTACKMSKTNKLNNGLVPVVQPIVKKSDPLEKKVSKGSTFRAAKSGEFDEDRLASSLGSFGSSLRVVSVSDRHGTSFRVVNVVDEDRLANSLGSFGSSLRVVSVSDRNGTSFRVVNVVDDSGEIDFSEGGIIRRRVFNRNESSGSLVFSDSRDDSLEVSESSDEGVVDMIEECIVLDLDELGLRTSEITCIEDDECVHQAHSPRPRTQVVTFRDPELSYVDDPSVQERLVNINVGKGLCHRCLKGNRFTKKEACIVCNAKYCSNCVLRAMGSMPEGRKCVTCIGLRIDESKRVSLGKSSRMLKRLLNDEVAKQIMSYEKSCEVNQLPPEVVYVNGRPLCHEELVQLLRCPNPPRNLKPRRYWYDKTSGLWGKEGKKPCQIISPRLAVGDPIMQNASNGSTNVMVNNREITKRELWMLKLAGVNCAGNPHFWVSADGALQEEGQKYVTQKLWEKPLAKVACAVLSLPIPSKSGISGAEDAIDDKVVLSKLEHNTPCKLLLVGNHQCGTSTIFKQAKLLYKVPFSEDESENIKSIIQSNLYGYLGILLEERERFEKECLNDMRMGSTDPPAPSDLQNSSNIRTTNIYSISPRLRKFSDWLLQVMASGNLKVMFPAATREYAPLVEELWKAKAFQATYNRRNEIEMLPPAANYFLDRAVEISRTGYDPSDMDILYAEGISSSNGIASVEFSFPKSVQDNFLEPDDQNDPLQRFQLIRLHASSLGENCKWLEMFEDVNLIIYCVSLTEYDEFDYDKNGVATNKMMESKKLFESIVNHSVSADKDVLLLLTKFDLLEEKIKQVPLTRCKWFEDFDPVISIRQSSRNNNNKNASLAQCAFHYIAAKFKGEFYSLTGNRLYVSRVTGLEADSVDEALKYGREILKWDNEKPNFNMNESSSGSVEASTSP